MASSLPRRHLVGIDVMRTVALVGVLGLHGTAYVLAVYASEVKPVTLIIPGFWFLVAINQFGRFSVPAFYFIAGYLLAFNNHPKPANSLQTYATILGKRGRGVFLPYVLWVALLNVFFGLSGKNIDLAVAIKQMIAGETLYHFYFFRYYAVDIALFPLFLLIWRKWPKAFWVILTGQLMFWMARFYFELNKPFELAHNLCEYFFLYYAFSYATTFFVLGLAIGDAPEVWKNRLSRKRLLLASLTVIAFIAQLIEFGTVGLVTANVNSAAANEKFTSVFFALMLILFFLSLEQDSLRLPSWARYLAITSMGIYVVHEPLMSYLFVAINAHWNVFDMTTLSVFVSVPLFVLGIGGISIMFLETVKRLAR